MSRTSVDAEPDATGALRRRLAKLEARLAEAEETLDAIRSGEVDAVVVGDAEDRRVFTLESADRPYRRLVEEMREGAITLSADGVLLYCNQAFADLVGASASQVVGVRLKQFVSESREPLERMLETGGRTEIVLRTASGERRPASLSLSPLPTDEGCLLCGVIADLTESRAHARDLADARQGLAVAVARQESEKRHRADLERQVIERTHERGRTWAITPDMLSVLDMTTGRFARVNPAWTTILGWSADELEGSNYASFVHPDDLAASFEGLERLKRGEPLLNFENRYRTKAGAYRWMRWVALPEGLKLYSTTRDVTDEKAHAAELAARTAERDRLWTLSQDMLARADYLGGMSAVNPAWTKVLGWPEHKLLTIAYAEFMHPEDAEPTLAAIEAMARDGQPTRFQNRILHADGRWVPIDWTVAPDPDGVNFIAVGRDLTEDKERERELQLAQEALRQSQKMEAMGQLTGGVAHDFNNLLTPIIGSLDMLHRRGIGGDREQRLIGGALQSADRAKTLVQRLLAFARRQPLKATAVDVTTLLAGMSDLIASTSGPQIKIVIDAPRKLTPARADPNQLEMAILNLAVNARDAMPNGGTLTLSASDAQIEQGHRSTLPPGKYVNLSVTDTGSGMDAATVKRAIEPFFSTKGIGKGTGLGLSMVHGLAMQLGGAMILTSEFGLGTKVELWLPVSAGPPGVDIGSATAKLTTVATGVVLLVDDEVIVRTSTAEMLSDLGYKVVEAESAAEALKLLHDGLKVDLLLTDHLMPGMTGTELAREARARWPDCPVMLISGFAEVEGVAPDLPRLTKPFRQAELAEMLATLS